jgi:hypothetical protein
MHADPMTALLILAAKAAGHHAGDYLLQSDYQAVTKGSPGILGRRACTRHVASLTAAQAALVALVLAATDTAAAPLSVAAGLAVNAATHWWADRRTTLHGLVLATEPLVAKTGFFETAVGRAAIDQAWHRLWLLPSALIAAAPPALAAAGLGACLAVLAVCESASRAARIRAAA